MTNKTGESRTRNIFSWTTLAKGLNLSIWVTEHLFKLLEQVSQSSRSGLPLARCVCSSGAAEYRESSSRKEQSSWRVGCGLNLRAGNHREWWALNCFTIIFRCFPWKLCHALYLTFPVLEAYNLLPDLCENYYFSLKDDLCFQTETKTISRFSLNILNCGVWTFSKSWSVSHFFCCCSVSACCGTPRLLGRLYVLWLVYDRLSSFSWCFERNYSSPHPLRSLHLSAAVTHNLQRVHRHTKVSMTFCYQIAN